MKIKEVIELLEIQGEWVNRNKTRDHLLIGNTEAEITNITVCWVATIDVIQQAISNKSNFIISHENPFYAAGTSVPTLIMKSTEKKQQLLKDNYITVYRCHDLWDLYPKYGVKDQWKKVVDIPFEYDKGFSFLSYSKPINTTVIELAEKISKNIKDYGQQGLQIIGNRNAKVTKAAIGTGACTDVIEMVQNGADCCIVSDDGINNWISVQWAIDNNIPLIVVNHMTCEAPGIKCMKEYLSDNLKDIEINFISNDYGIYHFN